jgi:hypothetical protein
LVSVREESSDPPGVGRPDAGGGDVSGGERVAGPVGPCENLEDGLGLLGFEIGVRDAWSGSGLGLVSAEGPFDGEESSDESRSRSVEPVVAVKAW